MDSASKLVARNMFKLRVHEAKGSAFQRLFERVMGYKYRDFTPIRPYGNVGDRKNDGYIRSSGLYFQVFAPENPTSRDTAVEAAKKAATDFNGLKAHWGSQTLVREFRFVFNDEYRGSPPPLEDALAKIRHEHAIEASTFLAKDLEAEALSLEDDQIIDIIGAPIPGPGPLASVDFGILREVIHHILDQGIPVSREGTLTAPDFEEKIQFNGLTRSVATLLTVGSYQSEAVKDYFSKNSHYARQELRDHLNSLYLESHQRLSARGYLPGEIGDLVFFDMLDTLTPPASGAPTRAAQDAAIVVMAYYFEACDIFEDPYVTT
jgi:hypothetical protein